MASSLEQLQKAYGSLQQSFQKKLGVLDQCEQMAAQCDYRLNNIEHKLTELETLQCTEHYRRAGH